MTRIFRLEERARRATFIPVRTGAVMVVCLAAALSGCGAEDKDRSSEGASSSKATAEAHGDKSKGLPQATGESPRPSAPSTRDGGVVGGVESPPSATAEIGAPIGGDKRRFVFQAFTTDDVAGRLKQEDVAKTFADNERTFGACLSVDAVAKIKLKVAPSGRVSEARVRELVPNDPRVRDCIARELGKLSFPKLTGTEPATVEIDLALRKT